MQGVAYVRLRLPDTTCLVYRTFVRRHLLLGFNFLRVYQFYVPQFIDYPEECYALEKRTPQQQC
jgi:hypothetical protein